MDLAIDDHMRHMNSLWAQLARHALRQRAQGELGGSEIRESRTAPERSGGAGEKERARALLEHGASCCATDQEPAEATNAPAVLELLRGGICYIQLLEAAGIEDGDTQR